MVRALPIPFCARALILSSCPLRSLTIRMSSPGLVATVHLSGWLLFKSAVRVEGQGEGPGWG